MAAWRRGKAEEETGQGHGVADEGEAMGEQEEAGQAEGEAGQGHHGEEGHVEGRRRPSGEGGRDLL